MYLEIDEGFDSHPKTVRLCRVMGDVNAGQYLIRIWSWACRGAPDGDISGLEAADVEAIAKYKKADGKLFAALTERWSPKFGPWIDSEDDSLLLHGWEERQGAAIARMSKKAADMRALRDRRRAERGDHVATTLPQRGSRVETRPDQTSQDKTSQDPDPLPSSIPASDPDPERARSNWDAKPTGYDLLCKFGLLRREILRLQSAPGTERPKDTNGKASAFAEALTDDEAKDIEATMRLALERIRDASTGWDDPRMRDPGFAFGAWRSGFPGLREEVHGVAPAERKPRAPSTNGQRPVVWRES